MNIVKIYRNLQNAFNRINSFMQKHEIGKESFKEDKNEKSWIKYSSEQASSMLTGVSLFRRLTTETDCFTVIIGKCGYFKRRVGFMTLSSCSLYTWATFEDWEDIFQGTLCLFRDWIPAGVCELSISLTTFNDGLHTN